MYRYIYIYMYILYIYIYRRGMYCILHVPCYLNPSPNTFSLHFSDQVNGWYATGRCETTETCRGIKCRVPGTQAGWCSSAAPPKTMV